MDKKKIETDKQTVDAVFSDWYNIPSYQRHYVWDRDNIIDLLDDICNAARNTPNDEYFLGSYVIQSKTKNGGKDLLDGQQRLTTLFLIFATLRDLSQSNEETKSACEKYVLQEANKIKRLEQRVRILFQIRGDVDNFIEKYIVHRDSISDNIDKISAKVKEYNISPSIKNISQAILVIQEYFSDKDSDFIETFVAHLVNNVVLIYVSADSLQDAFKFFSILNDRGVKLGNSDIIKSINLQVCTSRDQEKYAKMWEDMQIELGDDFERFLSLVRTIIIKEKAKSNLLDEFENLIFKANIISPGKDFFNYIKDACEAYKKVLDGDILSETSNFYIHNLIILMNNSFPSNDWVAVMMKFMMKFGNSSDNIKQQFARKLICKTIADVVCRESFTKRIENLNAIIKEIDNNNSIDAILMNSGIFKFDIELFKNTISSDVYGRSFCKTLLFILDFILIDKDTIRWGGFKQVTVEHILPQTPKVNSLWVSDFDEDQRKLYTHKIGNLCLLGRRKNISQGNLDYEIKKDRYFKKSIGSFVNSNRVISKYNKWSVDEFLENQDYSLDLLMTFFGS
ncbi:MAG: DUF262 domain-containing HNH endonuclease family protein [Rikenellaceae bacterium]